MSELFDKSSIKRWRRACHKEIDRLGVYGDETTFRAAALVTMSVYAFGSGVTTLAELTGQPEPFVRTVLARLRKQRVLSGQTLRVNWEDEGFGGLVSLCCDLLVAVGEVDRPVDPKRSAALKGKAGRKRGGKNVSRSVVSAGAVYTPKVLPVPNQNYQISDAGKRALAEFRGQSDTSV